MSMIRRKGLFMRSTQVELQGTRKKTGLLRLAAVLASNERKGYAR